MPTSRNAKRIEDIKSRKVKDDALESTMPVAKQAKRLAAPVATIPEADETAPPVARKSRKKATQLQPDDYCPMIYEASCRDSRLVMDVAIFRLSKNIKRANTTITYHLPDGFVRVVSGPLGMASVYDYDLVLMAASHLTEAMNRFREGKGKKPGQIFRPTIKDVLTFCGKEDGGHQRAAVIGALDRLSTTQVKIERVRNVKGTSKLITEGENLIGPFKVISHAKTKTIESLAFRIADWMYEEITNGHQPDVLAVNPNYFQLESGVARFLYRLARKTAGKNSACWSFGLLYERSGSESPRNGFNRMLRTLIRKNQMPDYVLAEEQGRDDALLRMVHRSQAEQWKADD